jgi:galactokinase
MIIRCTNKLFQELTIENKDYSEETYELFSWHANIIRINRRKIVVLMNDSNRYAIVLYGLRKNNFKRFDSLVKKAIKEVFLLEDINPDVIDDYFEKAGEIKVNKNTSRSKLTR